ncbi:MAG: hypothetical protein FWB96_01225 [Defluviitaleaceae bacterium]|nr:hypothetical protein [Defluviitaleaceae bacterium]MCL2261686.1 hypothetical protein [Defluviitaleaceae bacterium]
MVISVVFPSKTAKSGWGEKQYNYKSGIDVSIGDIVSVGGAKAKVAVLNAQFDPLRELKTITSLYADGGSATPPRTQKTSFANYVNGGSSIKDVEKSTLMEEDLIIALEDITAHDIRISDLENLLPNVDEAISQIFERIEELQGEIWLLSTVDASLSQLICDIQSQIDNIPNDNVDLSGILSDIAILQSDIATLDDSVSTSKIDIAELKSKVSALADLLDGIEPVDLSEILTEIQALKNNFATVHDGLTAEISNREEAISDKQQQITDLNNAVADGFLALNNQIAETNRVLSGHLTQRLTARELGDLSDDGVPVYTAVPKSELSATIPLIQGGSWVSDSKGRLGIYAGDFDADTAAIRTVTTSGGNSSDIGVARTVFFDDQIQLTSGTPVSIDTGIVLKDGADYQIVISAMSGTTGSSASTGNGLMPQAIINGAAYGLVGNQNANALLNTVYRFRWQMHNMTSNPDNNVVGAFPLFGGTTISTVIYSSSANFDVDGAGISTTYGTQTSSLFRVQTPVADVPTLRIATTAAPTGNMRFMVKIIEQRSAHPTN